MISNQRNKMVDNCSVMERSTVPIYFVLCQSLFKFDCFLSKKVLFDEVPQVRLVSIRVVFDGNNFAIKLCKQFAN